MKIEIARRHAAILSLASIFVLAGTLFAWSLLDEAALIILAILSELVVLVVILEVYRRLSAKLSEKQARFECQLNHDYRQIESLFSLFFTLRPTVPLPNTRGWASSPDLLKKIMELILTKKPDLVVEASSGVSTLVIAYCLKQLGKGRVVSLEHDVKYATSSREVILLHDLADIATVVHAPLRTFQIKDREWLWYDTDCLKSDQPVDVLVVDGPPLGIQNLSRYPALPLLYKYLNNLAIIILDDGNREDEKKIVSLWEDEFRDLSSEFLDTEKGAFIVEKKRPDIG